MKRSVIIAAVVGTLLTAINQGNLILSGDLTMWLGLAAGISLGVVLVRF